MGGGYWDNECTKKHVYFTTVTQDNSSDDKMDVDILKCLVDKLDVKN